MPHRLLSQLAHVEMHTPMLDKSVEFAVDILGLDVVEEDGDSVYLRCWGDYYAHSLILSAADAPGLGHAAWRAEGPEQLEEAVRKVEAAGASGAWLESSVGHGRAYRFEGPGGHLTELFWDVDRAAAPDGEESPYPDRPQRAGSRGMGVRAGGSPHRHHAGRARAERLVPRRARLPHDGLHRAGPRRAVGVQREHHQREVARPRVRHGLRGPARAARTTWRSGWRATTT